MGPHAHRGLRAHRPRLDRFRSRHPAHRDPGPCFGGERRRRRVHHGPDRHRPGDRRPARRFRHRSHRREVLDRTGLPRRRRHDGRRLRLALARPAGPGRALPRTHRVGLQPGPADLSDRAHSAELAGPRHVDARRCHARRLVHRAAGRRRHHQPMEPSRGVRFRRGDVARRRRRHVHDARPARRGARAGGHQAAQPRRPRPDPLRAAGEPPRPADPGHRMPGPHAHPSGAPDDHPVVVRGARHPGRHDEPHLLHVDGLRRSPLLPRRPHHGPSSGAAG